ncbi:hypothetical protein UUA_11818 [Rhodanobacter thiooxydans LCS2]|nr:hypothetical protein UUA_11818 [Rhodanobacter thiooxydans LCS2]
MCAESVCGIGLGCGVTDNLCRISSHDSVRGDVPHDYRTRLHQSAASDTHRSGDSRGSHDADVGFDDDVCVVGSGVENRACADDAVVAYVAAAVDDDAGTDFDIRAQHS